MYFHCNFPAHICSACRSDLWQIAFWPVGSCSTWPVPIRISLKNEVLKEYPFGTIHILRQHKRGGGGQAKCLFLLTRGGRGVSDNADVSISFFEKVFLALERQKNTEKSIKKTHKIIKEKISYFFQNFFKDLLTVLTLVLSYDKIQTGEI